MRTLSPDQLAAASRAHSWGYRAALEGRPLTANPYQTGLAEHWARGWRAFHWRTNPGA